MELVKKSVDIDAVTATLALQGVPGGAATGAAYAQGLRAGIAALLSSSNASSAGSGSAGVMLDAVLISSVVEAGSATLLLFNDSAAVNTAGNRYNSSAEIIDAVRAAAAAAADAAALLSAGGSRRRSLAAGSAPLRRSHAAEPQRRGLELKLIEGAPPPPLPSRAPGNSSAAVTAADANATTLVTFNVLAPSLSGALALQAALLAAPPSALAAALDEGVSAATGNASALSVTLLPGSVRVVILTYTTSWWRAVLDFLLRHIGNVLAGACVLLCSALALGVYKTWFRGWCGARCAWCSARRERARRAAAAQLKLAALQGEVLAGVRRARWLRVFWALRMYVRLVLLLRRVRASDWVPRRRVRLAPEGVVAAGRPAWQQRSPQQPQQPQRSPQHTQRPLLAAPAAAASAARAAFGPLQAKNASLRARVRLRALQPLLKGGFGGADDDSLGALVVGSSPSAASSAVPTAASNPGGGGGGGGGTFSTGGSLGLAVEEEEEEAEGRGGRRASPSFA